MTNTNTSILKVMNILFWIAFIGLCIKTGAILTSFLISLFMNDAGARDLYSGLNLYPVYAFSKFDYVATVSLLISLTGLKAFIAYLAIQFFLKFKLSKPFSAELTGLFLRISHVSLGTGVLALLAEGYTKRMLKEGISVPIDWSGNEILFFAGVIYIGALVFKKGTELQTENDLTV